MFNIDVSFIPNHKAISFSRKEGKKRKRCNTVEKISVESLALKQFKTWVRNVK